jgi:hypothetical protein
LTIPKLDYDRSNNDAGFFNSRFDGDPTNAIHEAVKGALTSSYNYDYQPTPYVVWESVKGFDEYDREYVSNRNYYDDRGNSMIFLENTRVYTFSRNRDKNETDLELFINGIKKDIDDYCIRFSEENGIIRLYIYESKMDTDTEINLVSYKSRDISENDYYIEKPNSRVSAENEIDFNMDIFHGYTRNLDDLILYEYNDQEGFYYLLSKEFDYIMTIEKGYIHVEFQREIRGDLVLVNTRKRMSVKKTIDSNYSFQLSNNNGSFITNNIPLPFNGINTVDIYFNGQKLVSDEDYKVKMNEGKIWTPPIIEFTMNLPLGEELDIVCNGLPNDSNWSTFQEVITDPDNGFLVFDEGFSGKEVCEVYTDNRRIPKSRYDERVEGIFKLNEAYANKNVEVITRTTSYKPEFKITSDEISRFTQFVGGEQIIPLIVGNWEGEITPGNLASMITERIQYDAIDSGNLDQYPDLTSFLNKFINYLSFYSFGIIDQNVDENYFIDEDFVIDCDNGHVGLDQDYVLDCNTEVTFP